MGRRRRESAISEDDFNAFFSKRLDRSHRLAWRLLGGDDAAAEDVVQDAFVRAFRSLSSFRGESTIDMWFYRILVRAAQNHNRRPWLRSRRSTIDLRLDAPTFSHTEGDPLLQRRRNRAVTALGRNQRDAFVLVHLEGFTVQEAAVLLRTAERSIESHLHRALTKLRAELGDTAPGEIHHEPSEGNRRDFETRAGRRARRESS